MARQLRIEYEGAFYHITSRGNQRERIFWDNRDRLIFQEILKRTKDRYGYLLHAYVFMDNHYHLLIETPNANLKQIMHNINTSYTVNINKRHRRFGHLFQGRYKSFIIDKESYLMELGRYIVLNPVRARMVERADEYKWSSYREYINKKVKMKITDVESTLFLFENKKADAIKLYKEFVYAGLGKDSPLDESVGSVLGDENFTEKVLEYLKSFPDKKEIPDIKKIEKRYELKNIVEAIVSYYGVEEEELLRKNRILIRQRKMSIYICKIMSGNKNVDIGKMFNVGSQAISNVLIDMEQLKEKNKQIVIEIQNIKELVKAKCLM